MNYQNQTDNRDEAARELGVPCSYIDYYAWPQAFGSTAGPFGGIGGQAMTSFTIEAYANGREAVIFCKQRRLKKVDNFEPMMRI